MEKNTSRKWLLLVASIIFMVMADMAIVFNYSPIAIFNSHNSRCTRYGNI